MRILSLDIGIKNLSYCILNKNDTNTNAITEIIIPNLIIEDWGNINLFDSATQTAPKCLNKYRGKICNKMAEFSCSNSDKIYYYCSKKTCCKELDKLIGSGYTKNNLKKVTTKTTSLEEYGKAIFENFESIKDKWEGVDKVVIENQPVLKNPTMKSIQMMVYSYFIFFGTNIGKVGKIQLCSAMNKLNQISKLKIEKLKDLNMTKDSFKTTYKNRKESSIIVANKLLENTKWFEFLKNHSKKDDLTDCFLQGLTCF